MISFRKSSLVKTIGSTDSAGNALDAARMGTASGIYMRTLQVVSSMKKAAFHNFDF